MAEQDVDLAAIQAFLEAQQTWATATETGTPEEAERAKARLLEAMAQLRQPDH